MLASLVTGTLLGLSAGFSPGPLLTLVISQSLKHNIREGIKVALSPLITDLPIIVFTLVVLTRLGNYRPVLGLISLIGGVFVLRLAYESVRTHALDLQIDTVQPQSFSKGIMVNALSPHPYLFWFSVGAPMVTKALEISHWAVAGFIASFYVFLIGSKVLLAVIAGKSRRFLAGKAYVYLMRVLGGLLLFFALLLLRDGLALLAS